MKMLVGVVSEHVCSVVVVLLKSVERRRHGTCPAVDNTRVRVGRVLVSVHGLRLMSARLLHVANTEGANRPLSGVTRQSCQKVAWSSKGRII